MDGAGSTQWESGAEEEFPPRLRRRTRLHEEEIDPTRFVQSGSTSVDVVDMAVADSDPDSEINNRMADLVEPGRRRMMRGVHDVAPPSLLDDLEHDLRPTAADEDSVNPSLGNVTTMDTASDASGAQRQVSARRGRRLRILGTEPTVEDLRSTNRFSLLEDDSDSDPVSEAGKALLRNLRLRVCQTLNTWWRSVDQFRQLFLLLEEITGPHSRVWMVWS